MTRAAPRAVHPAPLAVAVVVVALGGAVGSALRWGLAEAVPDPAAAAGGFPWTTAATNVVGSVLLALLPAAPAVRARPLLALALGTGVLGGFTTLSLAAEQARALLAAGAVATALAYVVLTAAVALAAVVLADRWAARRADGWTDRAGPTR
ncbi:CrcB family protein [Nocardioides perillae]|uniref:Fluoride-specific ion channel FluC n=1 Tax=Nocardioides perillae TaxID=1119534 RepID=A0A7Y9RQF7_9ACTN|nr:CrcB protein [Nocardioides perillae]